MTLYKLKIQSSKRFCQINIPNFHAIIKTINILYNVDIEEVIKFSLSLHQFCKFIK